MTGNEIGDEGAKAMSETQKVNTALVTLYLLGEEEEIRKRERTERKEE